MSRPHVHREPSFREQASPSYLEDERRREAFCGFGIMALPFDSGHVLGLRVMPENDYVPYSAVWHRTPDGKWSMYVDAPNHQEFCPRMFGPVLARSGQADIRVTWSNARTLEVVMDAPRLEWTVRLQGSPFTRLANKVLPHLPLNVYRRRPALALIRRLADRALGLGPLDLEGTVPGGQRMLVQPHRLYLVRDAQAKLVGRDLGRPVRADENPTTGTFRWPALGILAEGCIYAEIDDQEAYRERLRVFEGYDGARAPVPPAGP